MAKDRAKDPKRVPSLGINDPISGVRTLPGAGSGRGFAAHVKANSRNKYDAYGHTDEAREMLSEHDAKMINMNNDEDREQGQNKTIKISSDPAKGK